MDNIIGTFRCAGPCRTHEEGFCMCMEYDNLDIFEDHPELTPPLHEGCTCYITPMGRVHYAVRGSQDLTLEYS